VRFDHRVIDRTVSSNVPLLRDLGLIEVELDGNGPRLWLPLNLLGVLDPDQVEDPKK